MTDIEPTARPAPVLVYKYTRTTNIVVEAVEDANMSLFLFLFFIFIFIFIFYKYMRSTRIAVEAVGDACCCIRNIVAACVQLVI
jgi:hypothetical protein